MRPATGSTGGIAIFARAPTPGGAKRRLIPALGADGAAELQRRMTQRVVRAALDAAVGEVSLWCTPDDNHPDFRELAACHPVRLRVQRGQDLGERMAGAMQALLGEGHAFAIIAGSDCPALDAACFQWAARALTDGSDAALCPARDGGYVLIGARRFDDALFAQPMAWGTARVLDETRQRLRALNWQWREAEPLPDIDRPSDLGHVPPELLAGLPSLPATHPIAVSGGAPTTVTASPQTAS